ncbi:MAG: hypothetical protein LBD51_08530, partial [Bifidobacteriaceae bacterium]|nr:hypothetical protein [Bifidobacteriaceae bacterium]
MGGRDDTKPRRRKGAGSLYRRADTGAWVARVEGPPEIGGRRRRKAVPRRTKPEARIELRKLLIALDADQERTLAPERTLADWARE